MKTRIKVRRSNIELPDNLEDAYKFLVLRTEQDRAQLQVYKQRYLELVVDLVKMGYAEYDPDGHPGKVLLKTGLRLDAKDRQNQIVPLPDREGYENPSVTYRNVTASFMTRTVFLWMLKRLGFVVVGVTFGYFVIEYLKKWQIPI